MFVGDPHLGDCAIVSCDARFATTDGRGRGTHACTLGELILYTRNRPMEILPGQQRGLYVLRLLV